MDRFEMARANSSYTLLSTHGLRRQRSVVAAFAPCGGGAQLPTRIHLGNGRSGGKAGYHDGEDGRYDVPAARPGGAGFVRSLWRRIVSRSGSSSVKEQYGHEEYAQNFDEGAAAAEPENLLRSFSARYTHRRSAGLALR